MEKGKIILVVDDEEIIRELLSVKLREKGFEVYEAGDGIEAMEIVNKKMPNLVLLDVKMPKMNGLQVCEAIKENKSLNKIKVLIFTAKTELSERRKAIQRGADYYLTKPARFGEILKLIEELI